MKSITTFPRESEYQKAKAFLDKAGLRYQVVAPSPGYTQVGCPSVVVEEEERREMSRQGLEQFVHSGWVDYHEAALQVPQTAPAQFAEDVFGRTAVMVLAPCAADTRKLRIVAHLSGNLSAAFPYMNREMPTAYYNANGQTFSFMDGHRMVTLYPSRAAIAKADDLVDVWRTLESIRVQANSIWKRRAAIVPSLELRRKPPALEIYMRLPRTNCKRCGESACMAFALKLWSGERTMKECVEVFGGPRADLKDALVEICGGLG